MIKLTITQLGTPKQYQGTKGPYERNYLKAKEYNDKFLNFYVNKTTSGWRVGDVVEVEAVEEKEYTSKTGELKTSYDIKLPRLTTGGVSPQQIEEILNNQAKHGLMLTEIREAVRQMYLASVPATPDVIPGTKEPYPENNLGTNQFEDPELASLDAEASKIPF